MTTTLFALSGPSSPTNQRTRIGRPALRVLVGSAAVAALIGAMSGSASAAPDGNTDAHVEVSSSIALTGLTEEFTLTGIPGATVTGVGAVTMNVETNSLAGYTVTVQSQTATLLPAAVGNTDSIPIAALSVRETGTTPYTPVSNSGATPVHSQATRSAEGGDSLSNDYQVVIPFVNEDTYTATLDYLATTL